MSSFKSSLSVGSLGETLYFSAHPSLERTDGRKGDARCKETGALYELKSDSYPMSKTENLFIERYSDKEKQTPGGPYQSLGHGATYFIYFFLSDLVAYTFNTQALVDRVEQLAPTLQTRDIQNKSWVTMGYLVPRTAVADLATVERLTLGVTKEDGNT